MKKRRFRTDNAAVSAALQPLSGLDRVARLHLAVPAEVAEEFKGESDAFP